jgi:peptide/nickel transport system permease protein
MTAYVIRRVIVAIVMLFVMAFTVFALFFATPGDPALTSCGKYCTPEKLEKVREMLGYDKPTTYQYAEFVKGVFVGRDYPVNDAYRAALVANGNERFIIHCDAPCLGYSQRQSATVNDLILKAAPATLSLSVVSFVMWIVVGITLGIVAAVNKGKWLDRILVGLTLIVYALPVFFIGNFFLQFVSIKWQLFPYPRYAPIEDGIGPWFIGLILPAITLALFFMAAYVRFTRAFVLEAMSEDYIRTARAKGLPSRQVLVKHGLRAALTPLVTMAGLDFAVLLAGAVITESVFNYQGLGLLAVRANQDNDLPVLIGLVLVAGAAVIVANIIVDILYAYIDPRVRLRK